MGGGTIIKCKWGDFLMSEYLVADTDLTAVASAIRTKGGTSAGLAFPSGFISAIGNIASSNWVDISTYVTVHTTGSSSLIFAVYSSSLNIVAIYAYLGIPEPWDSGGLLITYGQYQPAIGTKAVAFSISSSVTSKILEAQNEPDGLYIPFNRIPYASGYTDLVMFYTPISS